MNEPMGLVCPKCRRPADLERRCPIDGAFYVTRKALREVGRDSYLGSFVGDRYAVLERLGVGGMGSVYKGRDEQTGAPVAVKFLREEYAMHTGLRRRFILEAQAAASVQSPHVVRLHDFGMDADRTLWIVMEYVEGWTVRDEVNRNGPFSVAHATEMARQVLAGLAVAHDSGVVHRDLKHDNIMFSGSRDAMFVRVLDFGVVKVTADDLPEGEAQLTQQGALVGSPSYMAPEQIRSLDVGPAADLYALGVVIYEAMTARRLFPASNYDALLRRDATREAPLLTKTGTGEEVPEGFARMLARTLAIDPRDRYQDARTMWLAIQQLADGNGSSMPADFYSDGLDEPAPEPVAVPTPPPVTPVPMQAAKEPTPEPILDLPSTPGFVDSDDVADALPPSTWERVTHNPAALVCAGAVTGYGVLSSLLGA